MAGRVPRDHPESILSPVVQASLRAGADIEPKPLGGDMVPVGTIGLLERRAEAAVEPRADRSESPVALPSQLEPSVSSSIASTSGRRPSIDRDATSTAGQPPALRPDGARTVESAARSAEAPTIDVAADLRGQEQRVLAVLHEYKRAYEHLDVQAAKAVWPSVPQRELAKAFRGLDSQEVRFASCGVSISGHEANARCHGDLTYRQKVGNRVVHPTPAEWTFSLSSDQGRWRIVNVNATLLQ